MPGIMEDITSVLQSPAVTALLPTALGAIGGALTSPRLAGSRGAIGQAALGAAQGLTTGSLMSARAQELQQNAQYYKLLNQQAEQALKDRSTDQPVVAGMLATIAKSPMGKVLYGNQPPPDFSKLSPETGAKMLQSQMTAFENYWKGQKPNFTHIAMQGPDGKDHQYEVTNYPDGTRKLDDLGLASQEGFELRKLQIQEMEGLRQQGLAVQQANQAIMHELAASRETDANRARFQTASQNLANHTAKIAQMLSASTPADPKTVQTLIAQRNAMAKQLKATADKQGFEYDPAEFEPMTTENIPGWLSRTTGGAIGGSTPVLAPETTEAPKTAKPAETGLTSKSGKKMVPDPSSPSGYSYAD